MFVNSKKKARLLRAEFTKSLDPVFSQDFLNLGFFSKILNFFCFSQTRDNGTQALDNLCNNPRLVSSQLPKVFDFQKDLREFILWSRIVFSSLKPGVNPIPASGISTKMLLSLCVILWKGPGLPLESPCLQI
jgi:hypothetical protein